MDTYRVITEDVHGIHVHGTYADQEAAEHAAAGLVHAQVEPILVHLTTSIFRPICYGPRGELRRRGDQFVHAALARPLIARHPDRICPACLSAWQGADEIIPWVQQGMKQILSPHWIGLRWGGIERFDSLFADPWDLAYILEREDIGAYYINMAYGEIWADDTALMNACRFVTIPAEETDLDLPPDLAEWLS